jgi:glutamate 5-kinase
MELPALVSSTKKGGGGGSTRTMGEKQALAAIGQGRLIALWDQIFGALKQPIAQILLTRNDIADVRSSPSRQTERSVN